MTQSTMRARSSAPAPRLESTPPRSPQPIPPTQGAAALFNAATNTPTGAPGERSDYAAFKRTTTEYLAHHEHAVLYGVAGLVAAILILIIGFWPTLLLAVFAAAGTAIGTYRDGNLKIRAQLRRLIDLLN